MEGLNAPHLHTANPSPLTGFNRIFAAVYSCAILTLLCHNITKLVNSTTLLSFFISLSLLVSDLVLTMMWVFSQAMRMCSIHREEFPQELEKFIKRSDFPALDVLICTADPNKEPPMNVVNTALSVMAYDYPMEKLSVYISDDGGSAFTLFAFMEAAKFARHWLPFCRENDILERCPYVYFQNGSGSSSDMEKIKMLYESMENRVHHVLERGKIYDEYITSDTERKALSIWNDNFTRQNHPTVIQVLLDNSRDKDMKDHMLPNLIYISREKSKTSHHYFKAGALNVLLRVSAAFTNAPLIMNLDCDMHSNDPRTIKRALCYFSDPEFRKRYAFVQFPQKFKGINKTDTYAGGYRRVFQIQAAGFDGAGGTNYVGTGAFFNRRALFGGPSNFIHPEISELSPDYVVEKPIQCQEVLSLAYKVAGCTYENQSSWGYKMGFRYGSLVEDFFTGFRLHCEGWRSVFCNPDRPAFLGDAPSSLIDLLDQQKRWSIGLLEVTFSKYSINFGIKNAGLLLGLCYAGYMLWPLWCIPITIYAFLPQLALLNRVQIFPKLPDQRFSLYMFLILGSYAQDWLEYHLIGTTPQVWWNDQRMWIIRGLSCQLYGTIEYFLKSLGIFTTSFNVTSKVIDDKQSKRYERGVFEFGVHSPMFVTLAMAALINLVALVFGLAEIFRGTDQGGGLLMQMLLAGYGLWNCLPLYEAMVFKTDEGKLPPKTSIVALIGVCCLCLSVSLLK